MANLAFQTLAEGHLDDLGGKGSQALELGLSAFDMKSFEKFFLMGEVERFVECDFIFLFDGVARMSEALGECAIVGHEKQAFTFLIEAPYMKQCRVFGRNKIVNRAPATLVGTSHNKSSGFVQEEGDWCGRMNTPSIDAHIVFCSNLRREIFYAGSVDHYCSRGDDLIARTPRAKTRSG